MLLPDGEICYVAFDKIHLDVAPASPNQVACCCRWEEKGWKTWAACRCASGKENTSVTARWFLFRGFRGSDAAFTLVLLDENCSQNNQQKSAAILWKGHFRNIFWSCCKGRIQESFLRKRESWRGGEKWSLLRAPSFFIGGGSRFSHSDHAVSSQAKPVAFSGISTHFGMRC